MHVPLRIGTRGSQLALWQARAVARALEAHGIDAELVIIRTSGDRLQDAPLADVGGKRLFVKEIEEALLGDEIDVAVHSAKDLPAVLPRGLTIAATLHREDPRDVFVLKDGLAARDLAAVAGILPAAPRIGTSSVRRAAQLVAVLPGAAFAPVRGNVDTRLRKLHEGEYDALVLAAAGLRRLGLGDRIATAIPADVCVPAPGQGIVAIETRTADSAVRQAVATVHDADAAIALAAERAVVEALGGGCHLPLGALATRANHDLDLRATVCSLDGIRVVRARRQGPASDPRALGMEVADELRAGGADAILDEARAGQDPVEGRH
jgi:hydroxymethylbilane synthase